MKKTLFVFLFLAMAAYADIDQVSERVEQTICTAQGIPGLNDFPAIREEVYFVWQDLLEKGMVQKRGKDQDVRPQFVALQGIVEHALSHALQRGEISCLWGVILTPMPATPLCTKGEISKDLVDPTIEMDLKRLFTVKARPSIVRDYLHLGGTLWVAYPREGLLQRTEEQRSIYLKELENYPDRLVDYLLESSTLPQELTGAVYLFDVEGERYAFAIQMSQAKDPQEQGQFGLWFGPIEQCEIHERVQQVLQFVTDSVPRQRA